MAVSDAWIGLIGAGVGSFISLLGQWVATVGQWKMKREELEAKRQEDEAKRQQPRDEFQKNTLIEIQEITAEVVDLTVRYVQAKNRVRGSEEDVEKEEQRIDICLTLIIEAQNTNRKLASLRERVKDQQMRGELEVLSQKVGWYLSLKRDVPIDEIEPATLDLDAAYQDANGHLGTILRALL